MWTLRKRRRTETRLLKVGCGEIKRIKWIHKVSKEEVLNRLKKTENI